MEALLLIREHPATADAFLEAAMRSGPALDAGAACDIDAILAGEE